MTTNEGPLPRPSLVTSLEQRLRADIEEGRLAPGDLLPTERELSARHGVARATVKQALGRLEQLGLIETKHGVGSRVRDASKEGTGTGVLRWLVGLGDPAWIDDLFEARRLFGPVIARQAAIHISRRQAAELERLLERVRDAKTPEEVHAVENEVHRALAAASGNRVLRLMVDGMIRGYAPVRSLMHRAFPDGGVVAGELEAMVRGVVRGEQASAENGASLYFNTTGPRLRSALRRKKDAR
jgi:DNA-binding FadR family transcriptional regulator